MKSATFELRILLDAAVGEAVELPRAGTPLEHPLVYDDAARSLKALVPDGRLAVVHEATDPAGLITSFSFRRLA